MSIKTVSFLSKRELHLVGCESVYLCLKSPWGDRTVNNTTMIPAVVNNSGRPLGGMRKSNEYLNARGAEVYEYSFNVDSTVFDSNDPAWINSFTCDAILDVFPYACVGAAILAAVSGAQGAQGAQGAAGAAGAQGAQGAAGAQGAQGAQGAAG